MGKAFFINNNLLVSFALNKTEASDMKFLQDGGNQVGESQEEEDEEAKHLPPSSPSLVFVRQKTCDCLHSKLLAKSTDAIADHNPHKKRPAYSFFPDALIDSPLLGNLVS